MEACVCVCGVSMCVCVYVCIYMCVCVYVCMYVCMYVCYVFVCVCMLCVDVVCCNCLFMFHWVLWWLCVQFLGLLIFLPLPDLFYKLLVCIFPPFFVTCEFYFCPRGFKHMKERKKPSINNLCALYSLLIERN